MARRLTSYLLFILSLLCSLPVLSKGKDNNIIPADCRVNVYLPLLKNKKVALIINQTSCIGKTSLLDTLLKEGVQVVKIFVPEHGFRGQGDAGANVSNTKDSATGIAIVSLYGHNKKPTKEQLDGVDVVVYDLQDVGTRFYTYISTLQYAMEACAENGKQFIVLDRPDPNGFYVDGPVLDTSLRSFVGMQAIPVVYGMTAGEYALMLVGEHLFHDADKTKLEAIPCANYDHTKEYMLPVSPSPNLKSMTAVYLYPSLCLFEGTAISVGRGTDMPFQQWGNPELKKQFSYYFTPQKNTGASSPLYENKKCYGELVAKNEEVALNKIHSSFCLEWLINAYKAYPDKDKFFNNFFYSLSGNKELEEQIKKGMTEKEIKKSEEGKINEFRKTRKKYLLYKDFE